MVVLAISSGDIKNAALIPYRNRELLNRFNDLYSIRKSLVYKLSDSEVKNRKKEITNLIPQN